VTPRLRRWGKTLDYDTCKDIAALPCTGRTQRERQRKKREERHCRVSRRSSSYDYVRVWRDGEVHEGGVRGSLGYVMPLIPPLGPSMEGTGLRRVFAMGMRGTP
jgi:hypothetical protein